MRLFSEFETCLNVETSLQEVLNSQELMGDELEMFARRETQKDVVVPKKNGEALGVSDIRMLETH